MKILVLALALTLAATLAAQTVTESPANVTVRPGQSVYLSLMFADATPSVNAAGFQWSMTTPSGWTVTAAAGAQAAAAQKQIACQEATGGASMLCIVYGLNQTVIPAGELAKIQFTPAPSTPPGTTLIVLSGLLVADATAQPVPVGIGPGTTLTVLGKFDLNGDGKIDIADVQISVSQVIGATACSTGDVNADSKCDLIDVLLTVLAALGLQP